MKTSELILRDPCKYCHRTHFDYACDEQIKVIAKVRKIVKWRIPEIRIIDMYIEDDSGWFRLFGGWGLLWKSLEKHSMNFNERNRYVKFVKIGKYLIKRVK